MNPSKTYASQELRQLVEKLTKAYSDEWLATIQYFHEYKYVNGILRSKIVDELHEHMLDEMKHANWIINRMKEFGARPILNPSNWEANSNCGYTEPKDIDPIKILDDAIAGERCAIEAYQDLQKLTKSIGDTKTYDIVSKILDEEIEHDQDLSGLKADVLTILSARK